jgi:hypothetical protein
LEKKSEPLEKLQHFNTNDEQKTNYNQSCCVQIEINEEQHEGEEQKSEAVDEGEICLGPSLRFAASEEDPPKEYVNKILNCEVGKAEQRNYRNKLPRLMAFDG